MLSDPAVKVAKYKQEKVWNSQQRDPELFVIRIWPNKQKNPRKGVYSGSEDASSKQCPLIIDRRKIETLQEE